MCMLQTHAPFWSPFSFWCVFDLPDQHKMYAFSFWSTFKRVFDENAQRFSVNGRPKRIEMYAFTNENALVWTGPEIIKEKLLVSHKDRAPLTFTLRWKWPFKKVFRRIKYGTETLATSSLGRPFHGLKKLAPLAKLVRSTCSKVALEASGLDSKNWKLNQLKLKLVQQ